MLLVILCAIIGVCFAYTTDILPNDQFCFKDKFEAGSKISGGFHVVKGGNMLIDFLIYDTNKNELYNYIDKPEGTYNFVTTQSGYYEFCAKNNYNMRKTFAFQHSEKTGSSQSEADGEDKNSALYSTINQIGSAVEYISKKQRFVLEKDARTMHTVKKTADKTETWCLIEVIAIGLIATAQIAFIFKVVQRKKIIGV